MTTVQTIFELRDSRDLLEKLRWELQNLFCRQRHDVAVCQYHTFNCAVTAWHITDWLWRDLPPQLKGELRNASGELLREFKDFQEYVREACPALKLCNQVANGSKHSGFRKVSAIISDGDGYDYGNPVIIDGDTHHSADKVFYDALFWFEKFLHEQNIFPSEPFVPRGDS
jgi:hypothetical protein